MGAVSLIDVARRRVELPQTRIPSGRMVELPGRGGSTYVTDTPGPHPESPTIVLLHALGTTGLLTWFPAIEPLSRRFRVVTLDQRWHGRGIHSEQFSLVDCADDVAALIDVLGLPTEYFGFCFGAAAAGVAWLAMFGVLWIVAIGPASGGAYLREYWAPVMLDPRAGDFVARVVRALASAVATPVSWTGSVGLALVCAALWLTGAVILVRRAWRMAALLVGPFVLAAIASMIGVYPLSDRLAFFTAPAALLAAAVPVVRTVAFVSGAIGRLLHGVGAPETVSAGRVPAGIVWAAALALGAFVGTDAWRFVRAPGALEPTQALFLSVRDDAVRDSTPVYVYARAVPAWVFATTEWRAPDDARLARYVALAGDRKSTRLNSSHVSESRMPSSA